MKKMQLSKVLFLFTALTITAGCYSWEKDIDVGGIPYQKFRYTGRKRSSLFSYSIGYLKEESRVNGILYTGYLHLRGNGTVSGGVLAEDTLINDILFPRDTWVAFSWDNTLETCSLPYDMEIQGYTVLGTGGYIKGARLSFYEDGTVKSFFSPQDVTIASIPCRGSVLCLIELNRDGTLKSCTLARDTKIAGIEYSRGRRVVFDESGRVVN